MRFIDETFYPNILFKKTLLTQLIIEECSAEFASFLKALEGKSTTDIFSEIRVLTMIMRQCLRNGGGFLPLFVADKAAGDTVEIFLSILKDKSSLFHLASG